MAGVLKPVNANISYDLAYNYEHTIILDLLQAATQAGLQFTSQLMYWMSGATGIPDWLQDILKRGMQGFYPVVAPELHDHVDKFRDALLQGNRVLLVSHSQGNFYANEAYELLRQQYPELPVPQSVGIYGMATPANNVAGAAGPYLTNNRDFIHLTPGALPANVELRYSTGEPVPATGLGALTLITAHSFADTYLDSGFNTRQIALDGILARLGQLQKPAMTAGNGPVTATLDWSGNVDLDLALLEPDGYFVSARAGAAPGSTAFTPPLGHVGYISQDAEGGPGSETYRSNCSQLSTGTYLIGAQYAMDKAYAHSTSENWCASLLANGQAQGYSEFLKSYCGLGDPDISPAPASGQLTLHTPDGEQTLGLSWAPGSDISYFTTAGSFQLAARLDVRETSGNQDPNLNGKLEYTITPLSGAFPLPTAWQSVIAMWAGQG